MTRDCRSIRLTICVAISLVAVVGCAPYRLGNAALFPTGIRTVHVPVVRNATVRHNIGLQLTEALIREIELRTPYKVTADPSADTILKCEMISESKTVLSETNEDYPRALDGGVQVRASWSDRQGRLLFNNSVIPTDDLAIIFTQDERLVPEAGQSVDTAMQQAIEDLAGRIVSQMETRW
ncbi:LPS assembly lipoprotein LptE [Allorhodopirellula solitaria]|nr:LPS assembly lipoprotein LptE [Allorhodopirellula solitaria]